MTTKPIRATDSFAELIQEGNTKNCKVIQIDGFLKLKGNYCYGDIVLVLDLIEEFYEWTVTVSLLPITDTYSIGKVKNELTVGLKNITVELMRQEFKVETGIQHFNMYLRNYFARL